jgi:serine/threonine protein kinase
MFLQGANEEGAETNSEQSRWNRELRLCEQLCHGRVVRYFGHEYTSGEGDGTTTSDRLFIFLEYCQGGSIASHLRTYGPLEEPLLAKYAQQLLEGLAYLHHLTPPVVHRDLKCANLLLTHDANVKIADFGCSKWLCHDQGKDSMVGSVFWTAPEVLRGGCDLAVSADYWSFGCCVLEMATAIHPWSEHKFDNILHACRLIIYSEMLPEVPSDLTECIKDVVTACLQREASRRPSAAELGAFLLLHPDSAWMS